MSDLSRKSIDWQTSGKRLLTVSACDVYLVYFTMVMEGGMQMSCPVRVKVSCPKSFPPGMSQIEA